MLSARSAAASTFITKVSDKRQPCCIQPMRAQCCLPSHDHSKIIVRVACHTSAVSCEKVMMLSEKAEINVVIEFSGGAELLFNKIKEHNVSLPIKHKEWNIRDLLTWIKDNLLKERPELFLQGETVRPGILVLVNDVDWELVGELDYKLCDNDRVVFISTLHGG